MEHVGTKAMLDKRTTKAADDNKFKSNHQRCTSGRQMMIKSSGTEKSSKGAPRAFLKVESEMCVKTSEEIFLLLFLLTLLKSLIRKALNLVENLLDLLVNN
jgi:hypothetical protein